MKAGSRRQVVRSLWVDDCCVIDQVWLASRLPDRLKGLLGRSGLPVGQGLYIERCGAIHTWGMRFALDLLFLDRQGRIVRRVSNLRPWRLSWGGCRASAVVEVAAGWLDPAIVPEGAQVQWREHESDIVRTAENEVEGSHAPANA